MTPNAPGVLGQNRTGTQDHPSVSSANVALLHSWERAFIDQDDEPDLASRPQSALKQSRLLTLIDWHSYKVDMICVLIFTVLLAFNLGRFFAMSFPWEKHSDQNSRIGPESFLYSPVGEAFKYQVRTISSSVGAPSKYKGPVSPEVDRAWPDLFQGKLRGLAGGIHDNNSLGNHIRISPEDMMKMNRTSVRLNGGSGDYIATPETYHQLHCLRYIFKFAHPEAYTVEPHHGVSVSAHVDHCIDSLRNFVQCHASTSVQTYSWKPETRVPESDVDIPNVCVDWDTYDGWVKGHSFDAYEPGLLVHPDLGPSFPDGGAPREPHAYLV